MNKRKNIFEDKENVWMWLVDTMWHHCTSMYHEGFLASEAKTGYARNHHLSSCLYFGIAFVEVCLNRYKRGELESKGLGEDEIYKATRDTFYNKTLWPFPKGIPDRIQVIHQNLMRLNDLRAEITHPKRKDHAVYRELDAIFPHYIIESVTEFIASVHEQSERPFPYWLLGWNFVGMNGNPTEPVLLDNSQFRYGLQGLGYDVPAADYGRAMAWEKTNMHSLDTFRNMRDVLQKSIYHIQPKHPVFLTAPRLTRRWWDEDFLRAN